MKYIYNETDIYTLLFRGGYIEIKPGKYYAANPGEYESGLFTEAEKSKQVSIHDSLDTIPVKVKAQPELVINPPTGAPVGLTEEQLKELKKSSEVKEPKVGGTVTRLGGDPKEAQGFTEAELLAKKEAEAQAKTEAEKVEESTEPVKSEGTTETPESAEPAAKRGRKAKTE